MAIKNKWDLNEVRTVYEKCLKFVDSEKFTDDEKLEAVLFNTGNCNFGYEIDNSCSTYYNLQQYMWYFLKRVEALESL